MQKLIRDAVEDSKGEQGQAVKQAVRKFVSQLSMRGTVSERILRSYYPYYKDVI
jgi:hypothetical protein